MESDRFALEKARTLEQVDLSRKGSVDEPIAELVRYINSLAAYYTTSSCSGRITVFCQGTQSRKQGCIWLLTSHDIITFTQLESSLVELPGGYTYFKFEPFVLHCMCATLECAQRMLQLANGAGFRNSGITCGKKRRIMLAVRSSLCLEVPVAFEGHLIVSKEYLQHLVTIGNEKLKENHERVNRFSLELQRSLSCSVVASDRCRGPEMRTTRRTESSQHTPEMRTTRRTESSQHTPEEHDIIKGDIEDLTTLFASEM